MAVQGEVTALDKIITGWVHDPDRADPVVVTLSLGDVVIRKIRPISVRKGLSPVPTGFLYYITSSILPYLSSRTALTFSVGDTQLPIKKNKLVLLPKAKRLPIDHLKEKLSNGYFFTKKGKLMLELNKDLEWQTSTFDFYDHARALFKQVAGYDLFATAGTLLGYTRERGFIGSDDDFDTCYISKHSDVKKVRSEMIRIVQALSKAGERIDLTRRRNFFYWRSSTSKASLDIFPAWIDGDMFYHTFAIGGPHAKAFSQGFKEVTLKGRQMLIPAAEEEACAAIYGPNWRTPDPLFQWEITPSVRAVLAKARVNKKRFLKAVSDGKKKSAAALQGTASEAE